MFCQNDFKFGSISFHKQKKKLADYHHLFITPIRYVQCLKAIINVSKNVYLAMLDWCNNWLFSHLPGAVLLLHFSCELVKVPKNYEQRDWLYFFSGNGFYILPNQKIRSLAFSHSKRKTLIFLKKHCSSFY